MASASPITPHRFPLAPAFHPSHTGPAPHHAASHKPQSFHAFLEAAGKPLYWTIVRIPAELAVALKRAWPGWTSRRVRGEINGVAFRTTLFPGPNG